MNNPFGLPDELFEAILLSVTKQAAQCNAKKTAPTTGPTTDEQNIEKGAKAAKKIYDSYVAVGFTETQAFDLLKCVLTKKN